MGVSRPKISSVAIELTAFCNQKCDYCYNGWREDGGKSLGPGHPGRTLARVERLLDAYTLDHVTLTGGEPLAHADFFDIVTLVRSRGVGVQIISNGGLVTRDIAARLGACELRFIQVTLNGPDAPLHEAHVGRGHFEPTLEGVRLLLEHGAPVVGCIVVTRKNAPHVGAILALWARLGVACVALSRFSPAGYAARHAAALLPQRDDLLTAFEQATPFAEGGMQLTCTMPVPPCVVETERFPLIRFGTCPIGTAQQEFAMGPDGVLRNCTLHGAGLVDGRDILDQAEPGALLADPGVTQYRQQLPEFCSGCLHAGSCGGGCRAAAAWTIGPGAPDPVVWQHIDDRFARELAVHRKDGKTHLELML